jgi:hypothetical protein
MQNGKKVLSNKTHSRRMVLMSARTAKSLVTTALEARGLLQGKTSKWAKLRLRVLEFLCKSPESTVQEITNATGNSEEVVRRVLELLHEQGPAAISRFGCPPALNATDLESLQGALEAKELESVTEAIDWVEQRKKLRLSAPCVRKYCRQLGYNLPGKVKPPSAQQPKRKEPRYEWSERQISELEELAHTQRDRANSILKVGTGTASLNKIAHDFDIPTSTLRLDVQRFKEGGVGELLKHERRQNILIRKGVWDSFVEWCNEEYKLTKRCPSGREAQEYLEDEHLISMPLRTVYTHLIQWKREKGLPLRARREKKKLTPSAGFEVRGFLRHR